VSNWLNKYGSPISGYELRAIESDDWYDLGDATIYLGFRTENFNFAEPVAVSCETCGALFTHVLRHLRSHRRLCGWDNGSPAVADA
jgi:hypothetical protein